MDRVDKTSRIEQRVQIPFLNPGLNKEIELLREKFSFLIKKRHELEVVMGNGEAKEEISAAFQEWASIGTNKVVNRSISVLLKKYNLTPRDIWEEGLLSLILDGQFQIGNYFLGDNFLVFIDIGENYKPQVYIQIFENTSSHDIRNGWASIAKIRDAAIGTKRFYPFKSLSLAQEILKSDEEQPGISDYDRQELLFGAKTSGNWGAIEAKERKKIKNVRHRAKKKSGANS
jgi:hypothetical protein